MYLLRAAQRRPPLLLSRADSRAGRAAPGVRATKHGLETRRALPASNGSVFAIRFLKLGISKGSFPYFLRVGHDGECAGGATGHARIRSRSAWSRDSSPPLLCQNFNAEVLKSIAVRWGQVLADCRSCIAKIIAKMKNKEVALQRPTRFQLPGAIEATARRFSPLSK